jgi:uncharacterized membrane protein YeaQ/YmgE (transglycosylase-associated protein family)
MRIPIVGKLVDERFLNYRLRSSSVAGIAGALVAGVIFEYRIFGEHRISWDLLAVLGAMVVVKLSMMAWFLIRN